MHPIYVFDQRTSQDVLSNFNSCGITVLNPTSCITHEELNGDYSLTVEQPALPDDDCWKSLKPFNIIRDARGQLFPIFKVVKKMVRGVPTVVAYAKHIFYYWNDKVIRNNDPIEHPERTYELYTDCYNAWYYLFDMSRQYITMVYADDMVDYAFQAHTSISGVDKNIKFKDVSVAYAIIGDPNSFINLYGGELYRNNFNIRLDARKIDAGDDVFSVIHGWNMNEIEETTDVSKMCTYVYADDNTGRSFAMSYSMTHFFPHHIVAGSSYSYDGASNLEDDVTDYFNEYSKPAVSYTVSLTDLSYTSADAGWGMFEHYNVGDTGLVKSELLGISTKQKIIATDYDNLTERNTKITLGNFIPSPLHSNRYDKLILSDGAAERRIRKIESLFQYVD